MLPIADVQIRIVLLTHLAARLAKGSPAELAAVGIQPAQLDRLRRLSTTDLNRMASMRQLNVGVALDPRSLEFSLDALRLVNEHLALEAYFIRNGASVKMMRQFFSLARDVTRERRRVYGNARSVGRVRRPEPRLCERIYQVWQSLPTVSLRDRYHRLHQRFPDISLEILAAVISDRAGRR